MLFFIGFRCGKAVEYSLFKYISCYSLSFTFTVTVWFLSYLNTSHVILYQGTGALYVKISEFKYISCYSLSFTSAGGQSYGYNLNTSHVILYQAAIRRMLLKV